MKIHKYCIEDKVSWDEHIRSSKVPHFMFMRDYMDYHSDRFIDCSLIFKNEKEKILGVLPANLSDSVLHSHQGLSFGGIILSRSALASDVHNIFSELITWCKDRNLCEKLVYKRTPDIYSIQPSQEDLYFLGLLDAHVFRRDLSTCIDLQSSFDFQKMRRRLAKKASKQGVKILVSAPEKIWPVIENVLEAQHGTTPVHTCAEMSLLCDRFPNNIICWAAELDERIIACSVIYRAANVAHAQYIASTQDGRNVGALDLLFEELIQVQYSKCRFFDFGISTEEQGKVLNMGLISQKQGFGGRGVIHEFYDIKIV